MGKIENEKPTRKFKKRKLEFMANVRETNEHSNDCIKQITNVGKAVVVNMVTGEEITLKRVTYTKLPIVALKQRICKAMGLHTVNMYRVRLLAKFHEDVEGSAFGLRELDDESTLNGERVGQTDEIYVEFGRGIKQSNKKHDDSLNAVLLAKALLRKGSSSNALGVAEMNTNHAGKISPPQAAAINASSKMTNSQKKMPKSRTHEKSGAPSSCEDSDIFGESFATGEESSQQVNPKNSQDVESQTMQNLAKSPQNKSMALKGVMAAVCNYVLGN